MTAIRENGAGYFKDLKARVHDMSPEELVTAYESANRAQPLWQPGAITFWLKHFFEAALRESGVLNVQEQEASIARSLGASPQ